MVCEQVKCVGDLINERGEFDFNYFTSKYGSLIDNHQYQDLCSIIPVPWQLSLQIDLICRASCQISRVNKLLRISAHIALEIYQEMISDQVTPPVAVSRWIEDLGNYEADEVNEMWFQVIARLGKLRSCRLRSIQYKFLHRLYYTHEKLFKAGLRNDAICGYCAEIDTYRNAGMQGGF